MKTKRKKFDYREKLGEIYLQRRSRNKAYSLAAFARDLGIGAPMLSLVLRKKRSLSVKMAEKIIRRMGFSDQESSLFIQSVKNASQKTEGFLHDIQENKVKQIGPLRIALEQIDFSVSWRHAALRELVLLPSFEDTSSYLSEKLNLPADEAAQIMQECLRAGFIKKVSPGKYQASEHMIWGDQGPNKNLRSLHKDLIGKALTKIDGPMTERSLSAALVTVSQNQYAEIQRLVRFFNSELVRTMKTTDQENKDRVICLTTQICVI